MTDPTLTDELELELIQLQLGIKRETRQQQIKEESRKLRIAEEQTGQGWQFVPVSDSKQVGQAGGVRRVDSASAPAKFYWWTLAMGAVLGAILVYVVMR